MSKADINYTYTKVRKNFGRQPQFTQVPAHMLDSIFPDVCEQKNYGLRNPVNSESQVSTSQKKQYINTTRVIPKDQGVNHAEGGWPKDIPFTDEDMTSRYRRRFERDDAYVDAVLGTYNKIVRCINQNNAIEIYQMFFRDMPPVRPIEKVSIRLDNVYKDLDERPISSLCWTFEDDPKLVVAYCNTNYPITGPVNKNLLCYVWDLENPNNPASDFLPPTACWQAVCSPVHPAVILGGLDDGRVCIFDIRAKPTPVTLSPMHLAHREPVSALVYMQYRQNFEFFSGSTDGSCMWWDIRNLSDRTDFLIMSVRARPGEHISLANAEGVNTLQYEKAFPTRFLCGTDTGLVINVNRKGKSPKEIMTSVFEAQLGPVKAVHRSPCVSKMFITCGDWTVHIWSEDVCTAPIVTGMPHKYPINDAAWAPQRLSSYMSVSSDGVFRYWDLLRKSREPLKTLQVSKNPLLKIKPHYLGRLIAMGDVKGKMYMLSLSDNLVISGDQDKQLMVQMYERETHREHILEARVKEIRLKLAVATEDKGVGVGPAEGDIVDEQTLLRMVEEEYRRVVLDEIRRAGIPVSTSSRDESMRQR